MAMATTLERAFDRIRRLPDSRQTEAIELLEAFLEEPEIYVLSNDERRLIAEAQAEIDRGEYASEAEVEAIFAKHARK
jgi:hypothetical protein